MKDKNKTKRPNAFTFTENRFNKGIINKLKTLAKMRGQSFASLLTEIVLEYLKNLDKD